MEVDVDEKIQSLEDVWGPWSGYRDDKGAMDVDADSTGLIEN